MQSGIANRRVHARTPTHLGQRRERRDRRERRERFPSLVSSVAVVVLARPMSAAISDSNQPACRDAW